MFRSLATIKIPVLGRTLYGFIWKGTRMNIAVSRAFGALRVVVPGGELEKDGILKRIIALAGAS
jgi:hypothetical protein